MTTVIEFYISDKERKNAIKLLTPHFNQKISENVEIGFFEFTKQYCTSNKNTIGMASAIYKDHLKNFVYDCQQNNTTIQKIKRNIKKNKYNVYNLAFLKPEEKDEDNWMRIILRKNRTEEMLNNLPSIEWKTCMMCKCKDYYYYQLQTRAADEPMTTFYICKSCGKTYRVNN